MPGRDPAAERNRPHRSSVARPVRVGLVRLRRVRRQVSTVHVPVTAWVQTARERASREAIAGLSPEAALYARRNFRLGLANGIIYGLADSILAPSFVLALFVNRLGAPNFFVGLIPAILTGGGFLPQMLVATRVQGRDRVLGLYRRTSIARSVSLIALTACTLLLSASPTLLLAAFFIFYGIYAFAGGVSGIPWLEMVSKSIPPRRRGVFFSLRSFWGGVLALLASGVVAAVMSENFSGLTFPYNFAVLFGVATVLISVALTLMSLIHEPAATTVSRPVTLRSIFQRGVEAVRTDTDYRGFMIARVLLAIATISDPFYVVYAKTDLGAPSESVGLYLGASAAAVLLSNLVWGPLGDRAGNRFLMTLTVLSVSSVPLSALLIPMLLPFIGTGGVQSAFAAVFVLGGLASGSGRIVSNNLLLAIAPPAERATYIGFLNTLLGFVTFVPPLGGAVVDNVGFVPLFIFTLVVAGSAMIATLRMGQTSSHAQA